ncbi:hypothetical protein ACRRTK_009931 [Alexandromys fortis]
MCHAVILFGNYFPSYLRLYVDAVAHTLGGIFKEGHSSRVLPRLLKKQDVICPTEKET